VSDLAVTKAPTMPKNNAEFCCNIIISHSWDELSFSPGTRKGETTMPFYLDVIDVVPEVVNFKSVMIVPCRFCPAASMAVRSNEPYIEFPRRSLKTAAYERLIKNMKHNFEKRGIKTSVFKSNFLHQFVLCMWTSQRRKKLMESAKKHDALVVMGCEAAVQTVRNSVGSTTCQVIQGMKSEGIMSIQPKFSLPCNIWLELESVTPYIHPESQS
jgi:hypothetical protein